MLSSAPVLSSVSVAKALLLRRFLLCYGLLHFFLLAAPFGASQPIDLLHHSASLAVVVLSFVVVGLFGSTSGSWVFISGSLALLAFNLLQFPILLRPEHQVWVIFFVAYSYVLFGSRVANWLLAFFLGAISCGLLLQHFGFVSLRSSFGHTGPTSLFVGALSLCFLGLVSYLGLHAISKAAASDRQMLQNSQDEARQLATWQHETALDLDSARQALKIASFQWDPSTNLRTWQSATKSIFGQEVDGPEAVALEDILEPEETEVLQEQLQAVAEKRKSVKFSLRISVLNSGFRYVEMHLHPVLGQGTELVRVRGTARDCTTETLYNYTLIAQNQKAQDSTAAKGHFLAIMSHEIRTPLNAVIGFAQLLLADTPKPSQIDNLRTLEGAARHLLGLINDILDFSKLEANKVNLQMAEINLTLLLEANIRTFTQEAKAKHLTLLLSNSLPRQLVLLGDELRINQIISNLLSNAIKFTEKGTVQLFVEQRGMLNTQLEIRITVADTGIGIPRDQLLNIFESFTQATSTTIRRYGGTGLGLTITKNLAEMMGGSVHVESEIGKGSSFIVDIPFSVVSQSVFPLAQIGELFGYSGSLGFASVLLVEDNKANVILARKSLNQIGISQIDFAEHGQVCLDMLAIKNYDLILMDLQMPVMDGLEAALQIRNLPDAAKAQTPIIALTASASDAIRERVRRSGIDAYATKPYVLADLEHTIRHHIHPPTLTD